MEKDKYYKYECMWVTPDKKTTKNNEITFRINQFRHVDKEEEI